MGQFDLYANTDKETSKTYPYFVDIQNDLLDGLNTRLVIPLTPLVRTDKAFPENLCPVLGIEGNDYVLLTSQMSAVPISLLKKKVRTLVRCRTEIVAAIDFLITGI